MKFNVIYVVVPVVICITIPWLTEAMSEDDKKYMLKLANRCKNKTGADDEDVRLLKEKAIPTKRTTKCLYACMQELFGIITKEGKLEPQALKDMAKLMFSTNPVLQKALTEIADECSYVNDEDRCELAYKTSTCAMERAKEKGVDYKDMF